MVCPYVPHRNQPAKPGCRAHQNPKAAGNLDRPGSRRTCLRRNTLLPAWGRPGRKRCHVGSETTHAIGKREITNRANQGEQQPRSAKVRRSQAVRTPRRAHHRWRLPVTWKASVTMFLAALPKKQGCQRLELQHPQTKEVATTEDTVASASWAPLRPR